MTMRKRKKSDEAKLEVVREALIKGENSGPPTQFGAFLARKNAESRAKKKRGPDV